MSKPHKWAKEIKHWADGGEIECRCDGDWGDWDDSPIDWADEFYDFRIKPQPKEPQYLYVYQRKDNEFIAFSKTKRDETEHSLMGKIKLEVDDGN